MTLERAECAMENQTMFQTSRFVRLSLTPWLVIFGISMPLLVPNKTDVALFVLLLMEFAVVCLLAGMWLPARKGQWFLRVLALLVFFILVAKIATPDSCMSLNLMKIMRMILFALPFLGFALNWKIPD